MTMPDNTAADVQDSAAPWTNGPWSFDHRILGCREVFAGETAICETVGLHVDAEDEANARLIAASPTMAEALRQIAYCDYFMNADSAKAMMEIARAAYAKARGTP